jgi:hypothetical protein
MRTSRVIIGAIAVLAPYNWHSNFLTGLMPCRPLLRLAVASLLQTRQLLTIYEDNCSCTSANAQPPRSVFPIFCILNHGRPLRIRGPSITADALVMPTSLFLPIGAIFFFHSSFTLGQLVLHHSTMRHYHPSCCRIDTRCG